MLTALTTATGWNQCCSSVTTTFNQSSNGLPKTGANNMPHRIMSVMDKTTAAISYGTSGTVGISGLLWSEWVMVIAAIFFAALTFGVNWWYQHRRYQMERERHASDVHYHTARMERIKLDHIDPYTGPDESSGD